MADLIIACKKGGTSIEDLADKFPDMIIKVPIDVFAGITDEDAAKVVDGLAPKAADRKDSIEQVKKLYELFRKTDCTMLEINPLAETSTNQLVAADAKLNFDDNAAFRQKEIFALRDPTQEDPREVSAAKVDLNYIGLDGEIGCMVNGAGLAMATMDIIKLHGWFSLIYIPLRLYGIISLTGTPKLPPTVLRMGGHVNGVLEIANSIHSSSVVASVFEVSSSGYYIRSDQ
ncbi:hypothetical protein F2Q68_00033390 [Brassica cretica]|uniref:ATP-grasp fold succinyl-CoA synthetase-type domain-containing protein n=1 Tax=Brassica cretica TaxID=69181 RepID=A0A8S9H7G8_BRACR|nr:hypothetical protein F2Q68_00033390 [Brassica cretica]